MSLSDVESNAAAFGKTGAFGSSELGRAARQVSNGPAMADLLARGGANLRKNHPDRSPDDTIQWLFSATLCRPPTVEELNIARQTIGNPMTEDGLADLLWCLFELPEFQLVE